ncbi:MAG: enoyl-CoA hydratase/isomerase family protein [Proteobacteria bacterium]|nr:enoyl-CoA hydratase/isomerase family protein [Pseudomonadota bacterium]
MENDILLIERKDHIATLVLNRPEKRNSLSPDLLIRLHQAIEEFRHDDEVRCLVIRGSGNKSFSSGYDIASIPTKIDTEVAEKLKSKNPQELAMGSVLNYPYPTIAMLNGYAFGAGCELAVCCDIRIAGDHIRMGVPPAKLGLVYPLDGIMRFVQILGLPLTRELLFTGRFYDAPQVREMGLVNHMVPLEELESFTYGLAEEIAGNAPMSLKGTKRILGILARSVQIDEADRRAAEAIVAEAFNSEDLKEGQLSFLEKRKPVFKGR